MTYYSALHYASKAEKSAKVAEQYAAQATSFSGKVIQLGFDGVLENGVLTFKHSPAGIDVPYDLLDDYEYELDLAYFSTDSLPGDTKIVVKNGADTITFVSALHRDNTTPVTVREMEQVMRFNEATGYRWLFKAAFKITPEGKKVFLLYPVVSLGGSGSGLEIGDIGFAPLGIDETQNKRRYLNGQVISQTQFVSFTNKIKSAIELYPNIATTEENWQAEVTNSRLGQCGKFVIDDALGTIRLPKVVNINGLQDLALMGSVKAESLPNITGSIEPISSGRGSEGFVSQSGSLTGATNDKTAGQGGNGVYKAILGFDASRSSSTYQDNAPVQQEAIQYPYFIQVATGVEESVDVTREIELNNPFSLLDYKWSEYELNNASWLLSNGAFHSGATYVSVYELLLKIKSGTETKDGVSVKLSTEAYEDTDFVINTADTTFRLPIKVKLASGNAVVGNGMTLGLTDGNYLVGSRVASADGAYGFYGFDTNSYGSSVGDKPASEGTKILTGNTNLGVTTDPTKSGIETSSSGLKLYFYVGETIQDANVINAGVILNSLATKTDSVQAAAASMPSDKYIDLTLGASGSTYTAPANGWFYVYTHNLTNSNGANIRLYNRSKDFGQQNFNKQGGQINISLSCNKGDDMDVFYWTMTSSEVAQFRFIYAEGEK